MGHARALPPAEFLILLALADGPKHGHGIKLDVAERTDGRTRMGPGTLYGAIKRLLGRGLIEEVTDQVDHPDDERLRYYEVTQEGVSAAQEEASRMAALLGIAQTKRLMG